MRFRIGIHLGDVMVEGDDVYGDGVNIAARLQERADPGGILISGPVYDQVHNKLSIGFDCLGQQQLKNVANPVTGYRVLQAGEGAPLRDAARCEDGIGTRYAFSSRATCSGRACVGMGMVQRAATPKRSDGHPRSLLVSDQRVQRPQPDLVSVARHAPPVNRYSAGPDWRKPS